MFFDMNFPVTSQLFNGVFNSGVSGVCLWVYETYAMHCLVSTAPIRKCFYANQDLGLYLGVMFLTKKDFWTKGLYMRYAGGT